MHLQHVLDAAADELSATFSDDRADIDQKSGIRRLTGQKCYLHRTPLHIISNSHFQSFRHCGQRMHEVEDTAGQWLQSVRIPCTG